MHRFRIRVTGALGIALSTVCLAAGAAVGGCQTPAATPGAATAGSSANDQWLASTKRLYYSSERAGLKGFDCTLHPDWRAIFLGANHGSLNAEAEARVALLGRVGLVLHARLAGGSQLEWNPPAAPADAGRTSMLEQMHSATEQTVQGFLQFWTPFIDNSVIPSNASGLEMSPTADGGRRIHSVDAGTEVVSILDGNRILRQYNTTMKDAELDLEPTFSDSGQGLLVTHLHALITQKSKGAGTQEMDVGVAYTTVEGFPIPARLDMSLVGTGNFNFTLDGCTVEKQAK